MCLYFHKEVQTIMGKMYVSRLFSGTPNDFHIIISVSFSVVVWDGSSVL